MRHAPTLYTVTFRTRGCGDGTTSRACAVLLEHRIRSRVRNLSRRKRRRRERIFFETFVPVLAPVAFSAANPARSSRPARISTRMGSTATTPCRRTIRAAMFRISRSTPTHNTGYVIYYTSNVTGFGLGTGLGGTSFVAPQLNGVSALLGEYLHGRIGLLNYPLYGLALSGQAYREPARRCTRSPMATTGSTTAATATIPPPDSARSTWRISRRPCADMF